MAPSDWATCHLMIGPHSPVTNTVNCLVNSANTSAQSSFPHHCPVNLHSQLVCHVIATCLNCMMPRYFHVSSVKSISLLSLPHVVLPMVPCHVRTTTCHTLSLPRVNICIVPCVKICTMLTQPENAKNE
jgi:hypothetical protein